LNILLTGGTGYIGSHAAVSLASAGDQITLFNNLSNSDKSVLDRLEKITHQKMVFAEDDVRDTALLSKTLSQNKIDTVMHFVGLKAVDESRKDPIKYYENNLAGSISLIKVMQLNNIKTLVFSSSATVYGKPQYLPKSFCGSFVGKRGSQNPHVID
jgi:UDP-glucose 4-epimerase